MTDLGRVRIGNQTAISAGRPALPFEFAVDHGFDAFEWFPDKKESGEGWTVRDIPTAARSSIREIAKTHDIRLSVHAPWPSNALKPEAETPIRETIEFARDIGAALFNMHLETELGAEAYLHALRPFLRLLHGAGIGLAIENTVDTSPDDFTKFFRYLRESGEEGASHAGICLDVGHANLFRGTRNDYLRFIDMLAPEIPIIHVHLHENYGDRDNHLPIFTGPAGKDDSGIRGLVERLEKRKFSGSIILEQWPQPQGLLVEARNRLIEIMGREQTVPQTMARGEKDIVREFTEANSRFLSWRKRLDWVLHLLAEAGGNHGLDPLIYIAIYLNFIGTGKIPCGEDGGHYRPSHHAAISERIYGRLVKLGTPEKLLVIRKIYPWLPSFDGEFKRAEPLTLIRDIAHRNDIPRELKHEIKKTLQNKLHRSAGPEDLAVSSAILERITAPGTSYPEAFVSAFRRFHEELKDFFNAGSLKDLIVRIIEKDEFGDVPLLCEFLDILDSPGEDLDSLKALELLTCIRSRLASEILTGKGATGLRLQVADVRLEDHSFVLLSLITNTVEGLLSKKRIIWKTALRASVLALANIRLGGFEPEECAAIEAELGSLSSVFDPRKRDALLRLKASADRCLRLSEAYRDKILALFSEKAELLGRALGVAEQAIRVYAEADVRSHPVFQLSKLASFLLKEVRQVASLPNWDVIVPGSARGRLLVSPSLLSLPVTHDGTAVVLVDRAVGDEEIPSYVSGVVIAVEIPLLSHLAVRARQNGTVFVFCGDAKRIEEIMAFSGKPVSIYADGGNFLVSFAECSISEKRDALHLKTAAPVAPPIEYPKDALIPLDLITPLQGGGKAHGARRLVEIAKTEGAGFTVPRGLVLPFGVMEKLLRSNAGLAEEYATLSAEIERMPLSDQDVCRARLKEIITQFIPPDEVLSGVARYFGKNSMVMVRSSSNCEDAEGLAGAGIYDSVVNVPVSKIAAAISSVWASLWNRNALEARRNAGIAHEACHMAVLIQTVIPADISFVMHTVNPVTGNEDEMLIECAAGLGETLVAGREPGSPFRMVYHKKTERLEILSFASYSFLLRPAYRGGTVRERVDYSAIAFSSDEHLRRKLALRTGAAGRLVERELGKPQDIEGAVLGEEICLVQVRPQQLLHRKGRNECPR